MDFVEKQHFYVIIRPTRTDFMTNPTEEDNKIMSAHFLYLKKLLNDRTLYLAGPTLITSDPFGLVIFETETEEEARSLIAQDPSIQSGIQIVDDFRPIKISLSK